MKKMIFLILVISMACRSNIVESSVTQNTTFFDTEEYINQFYQQYLTHDSITQVNILNGEKEVIRKDSASMNALKNIIRKSDINSPVLYDKYDVNTSDDREIYTTLDSTLQTRKVIVEKDSDRVEKVIIKQAYNNILSEAQTTYTIFSTGKIMMEKKTQTKFQEDDHLEVIWDFNKN